MWIVMATPTRTTTPAAVAVRWQEPTAAARLQGVLRQESQGAALAPPQRAARLGGTAGTPLEPIR